MIHHHTHHSSCFPAYCLEVNHCGDDVCRPSALWVMQTIVMLCSVEAGRGTQSSIVHSHPDHWVYLQAVFGTAAELGDISVVWLLQNQLLACS